MARIYRKFPLIDMPGEGPAFGVFVREVGRPDIQDVGYRKLASLTSEAIADDVVDKLNDDDSQWQKIIDSAIS